MDGWMDEGSRMDGWMDKGSKMDGWMDGQREKMMDRWWVDRQMDGWFKGRIA